MCEATPKKSLCVGGGEWRLPLDKTAVYRSLMASPDLSIATHAARLSHTLWFSGKDVDQHRINFGTVAACVLGNTYLVTGNGVDGGEIRALLEPHLPEGAALVVLDEIDGVHAEMRLLQEVYAAYQGYPTGLVMGVTKPCCELCAQALTCHNIGFAVWHTRKLSTKWEPPDGVPFDCDFWRDDDEDEGSGGSGKRSQTVARDERAAKRANMVH